MIKVTYIGKENKELDKEISKIHKNLLKIFKIKSFNIKINIYDNRSDFNKRIGRISSPSWLVANASNSNNEINILSPLTIRKELTHKENEFLQIIKHELAHLFINKTAKGNYVPMWLNEGIAQCIAEQNRAKSNKIKIEKDFCNKLSTSEDWNKRINKQAYEVSYLFTSFLIKKYSFNKIKKLISSLDKNYSHLRFKKVFLKTFNKSLDELEILFINNNYK